MKEIVEAISMNEGDSNDITKPRAPPGKSIQTCVITAIQHSYDQGILKPVNYKC